MSKFYNVPRTKGLYDPVSKAPFNLSRSKIELFLECPKCFFLDRRLGVGRPPSFPFNLNNAVDALLKKEFDSYRGSGQNHPLLIEAGLDMWPVDHPDLEKWRHTFTGIRYLHPETNFMVFGAIDDLWQNSKKEFVVVDYKATAKEGSIRTLDQDWQDGYKRQMEVYQWLLRKNGYAVSDIGYFVYCNGRLDRNSFDNKLDFEVNLIPYEGKADWIDDVLLEAHACLNQNQIPEAHPDCDYCRYRDISEEVIRKGPAPIHRQDDLF